MKNCPRLSVIIPVLNEAAIIKEYLSQFPYHEQVEVLIIDGGSTDKTIDLGKTFSVQIFSSPKPGRANQMNYGASLAQGEFLLFLHLDSVLPADFFDQIEEILTNSKNIAGAFRLTIDLPDWPYRWLEKLILWRSVYWQFPYGDQGLFLRRRDFQDLGGFADLPIMEDYELVQRLQLQWRGQVAIAKGTIITSGRRWQKLGLLRTTLINQAVVLGYHLGVSPQTLANWYRGSLKSS
jgi:rSAM/selenodomain-associated transferase 2